MTKPMPKWITYRYSVLWKKFADKKFNHDDAFRVLDKDKMLSIVLSELRQAGWLEMELDPDDARKRKYKLKNPELIIKEMERDD